MSTAIVKPNQTLYDVAVQYLGSNEGVFELAKLNGLDVDVDLVPGQVLDLPGVWNKRVRQLYRQNAWLPAADAGGLVSPVVMNNQASSPVTRKQLIVRDGQTFYDLAIQYLGSAEGVFALAKANGLNVDDDLTAGQILQLSTIHNPDVVKYYQEGGYYPAAGTDAVLEGIDYWGIEYTFEVQ